MRNYIQTLDEFLLKYNSNTYQIKHNNPLNEDLNDERDYEAITLGVGILNIQINENNNDYDFLYECLDENTICKCSDLTYEYLKEQHLSEDDISYCIECLYFYLLENELFKPPEPISPTRNKRDVAYNQKVAHIDRKRADLIDAATNRHKQKIQAIAQKRRATRNFNKNKSSQSSLFG